MTEIDAVRSLAALAQEVRLRVFRALVGLQPRGLRPVRCRATGRGTNTLSFHLKELTHSTMSQERQGRNLIYRASITMNELLGFLTENCCQGADCLAPQATSCDC